MQRERPTETCMKTRALEPQGRISWIGRVGAIGIEGRREGCSEGEPESTEGAENDERKGVAEEELEDAAKGHEKPSDEVVRSGGRGASSTSAHPAHQFA